MQPNNQNFVYYQQAVPAQNTFLPPNYVPMDAGTTFYPPPHMQAVQQPPSYFVSPPMPVPYDGQYVVPVAANVVPQFTHNNFAQAYQYPTFVQQAPQPIPNTIQTEVTKVPIDSSAKHVADPSGNFQDEKEVSVDEPEKEDLTSKQPEVPQPTAYVHPPVHNQPAFYGNAGTVQVAAAHPPVAAANPPVVAAHPSVAAAHPPVAGTAVKSFQTLHQPKVVSTDAAGNTTYQVGTVTTKYSTVTKGESVVLPTPPTLQGSINTVDGLPVTAPQPRALYYDAALGSSDGRYTSPFPKDLRGVQQLSSFVSNVAVSQVPKVYPSDEAKQSK